MLIFWKTVQYVKNEQKGRDVSPLTPENIHLEIAGV